MKTLETNFAAHGYVCEQLFRDSMIAIYHRQKKGHSHYETIRIQSHNGYSLGGNEYPPSEFYPSAEQWGVHGFTCSDYNRALAKAYEMVAADKAKAEKAN